MTDYSSMSDADLMAAIGSQVPSAPDNSAVSSAILGQESGNNPNSATSVDGAVGQAQITPGTWAQYAKPGEDINNPDDNLAVHNRIISDLSQKAGGDPARIAVGYFSGPGNIAPLDSDTPWKTDKQDGNGKSVSSYVSDVMGRMNPVSESQAAPANTPDYSSMSDADLLTAIGKAPSQPSLIDALKQQPDTSFVSNYGQSFINSANEGRLGLEDLGQSVGKALYGANSQDAAEIAGRKAELDKIRQETAQSGVVPSGIAGTLGSVAGSVAGSPSSWTPLGEVNGIADLAKAGAKVGVISGLDQNTENANLSGHLINAGVGAGEGALASAALGKAGQTIGDIPSGIANRIKGALSTDTADDIAAKSDANWDNAANLFKSSSANGAIISDDSAQNIFQKVKDAVGNLGSRHQDTAGVLSDFEKTLSDGDISPDKLHSFRQDLNDVISDNTKSKIDGGGINADGQRALVAKKALDQALTGITESDLSSGTPQAIIDLQNGINSTAKAYSYDKISQLVKNAEGDPNTLQRSFQNFVKNDKNKNGFTDDEWASLKDVAQRGTGQQIERALGTFGLDFGKSKNIMVPALTSGSSAIIPGGLPLTAAGTALRQTGKYAARGKAQTALDTIMERDTMPPPRVVTPPVVPRPALQGTQTAYINPNAKTLSKFSPNDAVDLMKSPEDVEPALQGTESTYFAKGGLAKNKEVHLSKKLEVKLGRKPKAREIELATYVGAHGFNVLKKKKHASMPAQNMFPA